MRLLLPGLLPVFLTPAPVGFLFDELLLVVLLLGFLSDLTAGFI
jgi:hypothetical protein